jgi:hypothetical protein
MGRYGWPHAKLAFGDWLGSSKFSHPHHLTNRSQTRTADTSGSNRFKFIDDKPPFLCPKQRQNISGRCLKKSSELARILWYDCEVRMNPYFPQVSQGSKLYQSGDWYNSVEVKSVQFARLDTRLERPRDNLPRHPLIRLNLPQREPGVEKQLKRGQK